MNNIYVLVEWPENQMYMDYTWFQEEAMLREESGYFIPIEYIYPNFKFNG